MRQVDGSMEAMRELTESNATSAQVLKALKEIDGHIGKLGEEVKEIQAKQRAQPVDAHASWQLQFKHLPLELKILYENQCKRNDALRELHTLTPDLPSLTQTNITPKIITFDPLIPSYQLREHMCRVVHRRKAAVHAQYISMADTYLKKRAKWRKTQAMSAIMKSRQSSLKRSHDGMMAPCVQLPDTSTVKKYLRTFGNKDYEHGERWLRNITDISPMIISSHERQMLSRFEFNKHDTDPMGYRLEQLATNPWTESEEKIFVMKYLLYPKNFRKIASFIENKSAFDVTSFYFHNKYRLNLKALLIEHQERRRLFGKTAQGPIELYDTWNPQPLVETSAAKSRLDNAS